MTRERADELWMTDILYINGRGMHLIMPDEDMGTYQAWETSHLMGNKDMIDCTGTVTGTTVAGTGTLS